MSFGYSIAAMIQTFFVVAFLIILIPFCMPTKKALRIMGLISLIMCLTAGVLSSYYGIIILKKFGYLILGIPLYFLVYLFSKAKESRYLFVVMSTLIFHKIISTLLMVLRVYSGGLTFVYFLMNFIMFGALLYGAWKLRSDFHKIVFTYQKEFNYLSAILIVLFILIWLFSPIMNQDTVDTDILGVVSLLYLLTILLYLFIGFSFHSFSKRLDMERDTLSLTHQIQMTKDHITLMQSTQDKARLYRHDLRHHLLIINEFMDTGNLDGLKQYLIQTKQDLDSITPKRLCPNETAGLLLSSFTLQAQKKGVELDITAQIPKTLTISNTDLCTLLSNALENAITATSQIDDNRKKSVKLSARFSDGKLLILIENPYTGSVIMENGLPQNTQPGHGFGTKSIETIVQKYEGLSLFEAQDGTFTLRIAI